MSWSHDIHEDEAHLHSLVDPSLDDVLRVFQSLDSDLFPSLTLSLDRKGERYPKLFIHGGPSGYAVSLSEGDHFGNCKESMLRLINPHAFDLPACCYRVIGRTYPGIEIEERFLSSDAQVVQMLIEYFAQTGRWKPDIPYIVEQEDEDDLLREYVQTVDEFDEAIDHLDDENKM